VRSPAGELSRTITFTPQLDNIVEGEETVSVQLTDYGAVYAAPVENTVELIIADFIELMFKDSFEEIDP